jgi:hypothetical protein
MVGYRTGMGKVLVMVVVAREGLSGNNPTISFGSEGDMAMIQQLRIYEIFEKNKVAFHARFRDHAARIMRTKYGFQIVAMWETRLGERTEFAYLLEWPDETTKTAAWSAFMADTEWSEIKRVTHAEHGLMVGQIEDRLLAQADYSPAKERSLLQNR